MRGLVGRTPSGHERHHPALERPPVALEDVGREPQDAGLALGVEPGHLERQQIL
jgi:hypothetical protein